MACIRSIAGGSDLPREHEGSSDEQSETGRRLGPDSDVGDYGVLRAQSQRVVAQTIKA